MKNLDEYGRAYTLAHRLLHRPTPCSSDSQSQNDTHDHDPQSNEPFSFQQQQQQQQQQQEEEEDDNDDDMEDDDAESTAVKCPFVTLSVCSTSSAYFFPSSRSSSSSPSPLHSLSTLPLRRRQQQQTAPRTPNRQEEDSDPSVILYHSVLRSHPPITGNYHHTPLPNANASNVSSAIGGTTLTTLSSAQVLEGYMSRIQVELGITPQQNHLTAFSTLLAGAGAGAHGNRTDNRNSRRNRGRTVRNGRNPRSRRAANSTPTTATNTKTHSGTSNPSPTPPPQQTPQETEIYQTIAHLTSIVLPPPPPTPTYTTLPLAKTALHTLGQSLPRRVCQHPFKRNDIVWVCRTCQSDETCVLCHECFSQSNHEGHDVKFYHAQAGGCCDCGDPDAWDPKGFCPRHGGGGGYGEEGSGGE